MPTVFSIDERAQHSRELGGLTFAAIAPIMGLHEAVKSVYDSMQGKGGAVGGCGGSGGCGGCGGCGG
jgi:hypothetical protein